MSNVTIVGAQWGDEGKGKLVDRYAARADWVVRFQGGNNAGHTLVVGGEKTVLHLVPSGILQPKARCAIGNGVVVDPLILKEELETLRARGITTEGRLFVSWGAHCIMPYHRRLDEARESTRGVDKIGTTKRGIGPTYEDKIARRGVRVADLVDSARLEALIRGRLVELNAILAAHDPELCYQEDDVAEMVNAYHALGQELSPYFDNVSSRLYRAEREGQNLLYEGAQGILLDIDHGTYPFVTSSNTVAAAGPSGAGLGPKSAGTVVGIMKAYTTRVGAGPFVSELHDDAGDALRDAGSEFGATTGRPRRCGWLDFVALRYAVRTAGLDQLAVTKLDVLAGLPEIAVCTAYELDGRNLTEFPDNVHDLARAKPVYETLPGFSDVSAASSRSALPKAAKDYLDRIEAELERPICFLSLGPGREEGVEISDPFQAS